MARAGRRREGSARRGAPRWGLAAVFQGEQGAEAAKPSAIAAALPVAGEVEAIALGDADVAAEDGAAMAVLEGVRVVWHSRGRPGPQSECGLPNHLSPELAADLHPTLGLALPDFRKLRD